MKISLSHNNIMNINDFITSLEQLNKLELLDLNINENIL
jgi:hypothetical protein